MAAFPFFSSVGEHAIGSTVLLVVESVVSGTLLGIDRIAARPIVVPIGSSWIVPGVHVVSSLLHLLLLRAGRSSTDALPRFPTSLRSPRRSQALLTMQW